MVGKRQGESIRGCIRMKAKWCKYFGCWCNEVEEVIEEEMIDCDIDCNNCDMMEIIKI